MKKVKSSTCAVLNLRGGVFVLILLITLHAGFAAPTYFDAWVSFRPVYLILIRLLAERILLCNFVIRLIWAELLLREMFITVLLTYN